MEQLQTIRTREWIHDRFRGIDFPLGTCGTLRRGVDGAGRRTAMLNFPEGKLTVTQVSMEEVEILDETTP